MLLYKPISEAVLKKFNDELDLFKVIDPKTKCWNWTGMVDRHGYGYINEYINHRISRHYFTHRLSFKLHNPKINIDKSVVRHQCDNPSCFNPRHLLAGTQLDNLQDARIRNRMTTGEKSNLCIYPDSLISKIRREFAQGGTNYNRLSKKYGLSREYIRQLILNKRRS